MSPIYGITHFYYTCWFRVRHYRTFIHWCVLHQTKFETLKVCSSWSKCQQFPPALRKIKQINTLSCTDVKLILSPGIKASSSSVRPWPAGTTPCSMQRWFSAQNNSRKTEDKLVAQSGKDGEQKGGHPQAIVEWMFVQCRCIQNVVLWISFAVHGRENFGEYWELQSGNISR